MLGPPANRECNDSEHVINQLESLECATWHPLFIRDHFSEVVDHVRKNVKYDSPNSDNKWGYQYHISNFLKTIPVDFNNYMNVKNYIVIDNFTYHDDEGKNKYSVRNPRSVYEIFWGYCGKFKLDRNIWDDKEMEGIRNLHQSYKMKYNQYSFFTTDEEGLNAITDAYIYMYKLANEK